VGVQVDQSGQHGEAVKIDDGRVPGHLDRARRTDLHNHAITDQHRGIGLRLEISTSDYRRTD
jgi:hypothetical protein